jgi:hypothetical protein
MRNWEKKKKGIEQRVKSSALMAWFKVDWLIA